MTTLLLNRTHWRSKMTSLITRGRISEHPHDDFGAQSTLTGFWKSGEADEAHVFSHVLDSRVRDNILRTKRHVLFPAHRKWDPRNYGLEDHDLPDKPITFKLCIWYDHCSERHW